MSNQHQSVLLSEVISGLTIKPDGVYIDGTFGRGGHSRAILEKLSQKGRLIGIDKDPAAIQFAEQTLGQDKRFSIVHAAFSQLLEVAKAYQIVGKVDGILLDLGVSSPQLDEAERGFSFLQNGPLDMRMNPQSGEAVAEWINRAKESAIVEVLFKYGEEKFARRMASAIVKQRELEPIMTTARLAEIVAAANPRWEKFKHPATRVFQALRIFINQELQELETCLANVLEILAVGGHLAVISFHSLEDRIVKRFIRRFAHDETLPINVPVRAEELQPRLKNLSRAIKPSKEEVGVNPRSRSAVLRLAEKIR